MNINLPKPLKFTIVLIWLLLLSSLVKSQNLAIKFLKLNWPEKWWVVSHPLSAAKAYHISNFVNHYCDTISADSVIDTSNQGGTRDAFKHALWMICLCNEMHWKKAEKLGIAHEKSSKIDFKKRRNEDGALPDSVSSQMDALNNKAGINIYRQNPNLTLPHYTFLVKQAIINGNLWVILKDTSGNYTDCCGHIIEYHHQNKLWNTPECIVKSNFKPTNIKSQIK